MILPWHGRCWQHLQTYIERQRIPQALLITGNKGMGKQCLADRFAAGLFCSAPQADGNACGQCSSCLLLKAETYPDYIQVRPEEEGKDITIGQIRALITRLSLKPQFETQRVVIINPADKMNNAAANAFLKCLEEPTERTSIILISEKPSKLLPTIISRCQKLQIETPDTGTASAWLAETFNGGTVGNDALTANLALAQGAPLLARQYAEENTLTVRNACFNGWIEIAKQQKSPVIIAEEWQRLALPPLLFWITSWVIDAIKCRHSRRSDNSFYNPDLSGQLKQLSERLELKGLYRLYDLLLASRQRLETQVNKQLLLEEILISWQELNRSK